jgi:predicted AAA+ superfamily ATPase
VELIAPYARNAKKEISKSPVPYFWDLGLRNFSLGLFGHLESPFEKGFVFENFVFLLLRQKLRFKAAKLNYWRTKDKAEVDFVIEAGPRLIPVEVKFKHLKQDKVPASLRSFIDKYNPEQAYIINLALSKTLKIKKTTLFFMPFHELLRKTAVL